MYRTLARFALATVATTLMLACAGERATFDDLVSRHQERAGLVYADCGDVDHRLESDACAAVTPEEQCIIAAFQQCEGAILRVRDWTIEGAPIPSVILVDVDGGGCSVTTFVDSSADAYKGSGSDVQQFACAGIEGTDSGPCLRAQPTDCELISEW